MDEVAKKRRKTLWCEICHKFNHNTNDCFKNPSNLPNIEYPPLTDFGVDFEGEGGEENIDFQEGMV